MISAVMGNSFLFPHSKPDSYISPKSNLWKKKRKKISLVHVWLPSGIGSRSSAIFEHKNVHIMHFLFVFRLLLEGKGGGIFGHHNLPSGNQKFILDRSPVGARIKKLISDPDHVP